MTQAKHIGNIDCCPEIKSLYEKAHFQFYYDDGVLKFKPRKHLSKKFIDTVAGRIKMNGTGTARYHFVTIDGKEHKRSRITFLMYHGYLPAVVDHINVSGTNHTDDSIDNLRAATLSQNMQNQRQRTSRSGYTGIKFNACGTFTVRITRNGVRAIERTFNSLKEALAHRVGLEQQLFGEYARAG